MQNNNQWSDDEDLSAIEGTQIFDSRKNQIIGGTGQNSDVDKSPVGFSGHQIQQQPQQYIQQQSSPNTNMMRQQQTQSNMEHHMNSNNMQQVNMSPSGYGSNQGYNAQPKQQNYRVINQHDDEDDFGYLEKKMVQQSLNDSNQFENNKLLEEQKMDVNVFRQNSGPQINAMNSSEYMGSNMMRESQMSDLNEDMYQQYNPYDSVEVSEPMWSNDGVVGGHRLYKIMTITRGDGQVIPIQVHRRYSDLVWLVQALQVVDPGCIIPPIPQKILWEKQLQNNSQQINQRIQGIQRFLDSMIQHPILCGNEDLRCFLTGQDKDLESKKREIQERINSSNLNKNLSVVLCDGSESLKQVGGDGTYIKQTVNVVKSAASGLMEIGGTAFGFVSSGAQYLTGQPLGQDQMSTTNQMRDPASFKNMTQEEQGNLKELDKFHNDEKFINKMLEKYTQLESKFYKLILIQDEQMQNYSKMSEKFGNLNQLESFDQITMQKISELNGDNYIKHEGEKYEKLQQASHLASQAFSSVQSLKKNEVDILKIKYKEPLENIRLLLIGATSACQRYRILINYNHEKQREIRELNCTPAAQSLGVRPPQNQVSNIPIIQDIYMPGNNMNEAVGLKNNVSDENPSERAANYFYELKRKQEEVQQRIDIASNYLTSELKKFKRRMLQEFNGVVVTFAHLQMQQQARMFETWNGFIQHKSAIDWQQNSKRQSGNPSQRSRADSGSVTSNYDYLNNSHSMDLK